MEASREFYAIQLLPDDGAAFYRTSDPAEVHALVYPHYCSLCGALNGNPDDGEGDCRHKIAAVLKRDQAIADSAPDIDERRDAYYQAGHYPPSPVYY
jgi:hypothetical protein